MIYENLDLSRCFPAAMEAFVYSNSASMNFAPNLFPFYYVNPMFNQSSTFPQAVSPIISENQNVDIIENPEEKLPDPRTLLARRRLNRSLKNKRWTFEEDTQLIGLIKTYSLDWYKISAKMKDRAPDALKNRFYGVLKKNLPAQLIKELDYSIRTTRQIKKDSNIKPYIADEWAEETNTKIIESSIKELEADLQHSEALPKNEKKILLEKLKGNMDKLEEHLSLVRNQIITLSTKSLASN
ncbi:unnamed protein product [Blepharisma stoltei]|uniref:Myb-like DNA-binding domain containing protein n=1 Tax=Blepharisma stoltei TaxID=1481888 RepID=A0AAU9IG45_9CILI|nr:unnamed protein product [Blepharisma stoltei]